MTVADGSVAPGPAVPDALLPRQSAWAFRRVMAWATLRPAWSVVDRSYGPPDLRNPEVIARAAAAYRALPAGGDSPVEKRIWMLWQQGWDRAPDLVRRCAQSWRERNPGWELTLLDENSLPDVLGEAARIPDHLSRQHRADLARTLLLAEHGGVWADATCFCARPLDDWLPGAAPAGFFMFAYPRPYRLVDNWFIAAARSNRVIAGMADLMLQYVERFRRPHHYFFMIYLVEALFRIDSEARRIWQETARLPAAGPLVVQRHALDSAPMKAVMDLIEEGQVPVHKLMREWTSNDLTGTPLHKLTDLHSVSGTGH